MNKNETFFIIIYPTGQLQYIGITPVGNARPEEYMLNFVRNVIMTKNYSYVNCNNCLLHKYGIGVSDTMQKEFIMFYGFDGIENELASYIVQDDELPRSTDGHVGMIGTVVIAWLTPLPNGKSIVSGVNRDDAKAFVAGLLELYKKEYGVELR